MNWSKRELLRIYKKLLRDQPLSNVEKKAPVIEELFREALQRLPEADRLKIYYEAKAVQKDGEDAIEKGFTKIQLDFSRAKAEYWEDEAKQERERAPKIGKDFDKKDKKITRTASQQKRIFDRFMATRGADYLKTSIDRIIIDLETWANKEGIEENLPSRSAIGNYKKRLK